jgi:nitrogen fixation protein NifB
MELKVLQGKSNPSQRKAARGAHPSANSPENSLPEHIQRQIEDHPCYSEKAHHHFARMHVAVAPACNIQCNYCNRKYDCSNESRPGVVSELLSPEQAIQKTLAVAASVPEMSVLGIAGPGDPLANPERTFETFQALSEKAPDIKLCVSTNGLNLPNHIDELVNHNIGHVTITINCIDPDIGAKIYPWIYWNHRRIRGRKAAEILIEQQQKGLEMLVARGVLVKVNSVMIPGVNDEHLKEVNRVVKEKGAFLHNIMPLIARPEHGTFYGVMGQREPTAEELQALQDACGGDMRMMRHCRQCRSDAVGKLGEDRSNEFSLDKVGQMDIDYEAAVAKRAEVKTAIHKTLEEQRCGAEKGETFVQLMPVNRRSPNPSSRPVLVAVASKGGGLINQHFGHAKEFLVYEASSQGVRFIGPRKTDLYCSGLDTCGDAETTLEQTIRALQGCEIVLCAKIGYGPWEALENAGIQPNSEHALEPIEEAAMAVYQELMAAGKLDDLTAETGQASA